MIDINDQAAKVAGMLPGGQRAAAFASTARFPEPESALGPRRFLDILLRRWRLIAWFIGCGTVAIVGLALFLPPTYTAKTQIVVEESRTPRTDESAPRREAGPDQATIQTQVTALSAHDLLASVITQLAADPAFRAIQRRGPGSIPELSGTAKSNLAVERLGRHLHVFQESGSHVIALAYSSRDPAEAAAIANKITAYYLAAGQAQARAAPSQALSLLTHTIADLRSEAESLETAVAAYQTAHGVNDAYKTNLIDQKLGDLNHQLAMAQAELAARKVRYEELRASRGTRGDWSPLLAGLDAQGLVELHSQVAGVLEGRQDSVVMPRSGGSQVQPAPPALGNKIRGELDQALGKLWHDERVASAQVAAIEQRLGAVQRASDDVQLHDLVTAAASARHRYERLVQRRNELLEQGDDVTAPARLLSWAAVPRRPSSLSPLLFMPPALVALLVLACLAALLRERLDQGIYDGFDVASLGVRCAGIAPWSATMIPPVGASLAKSAATLSFTESLRGIMVSLQLAASRGCKPHVILVTSSVSGEGKTTLARSLAACAAEAGAKVLLLDLDERAASGLPPSVPVGEVTRALERNSEPGTGVVGEALARERARIEALPTRAGPGLDYLPVRRRTSVESTALLSIDHMAELLRSQRASYDLIFIDSAAVLEKAEVRVLAAIAHQIVLAVRWRKTRRDDVRAALALLRGCGANGGETAAPISAAVTQVARRKHVW